ncbi:hypothetical protein A1A1_17595 [Planococcus antarcticus DSM 14505]|uniref:DUF1259 domain-containing protein n=1 Tax=Planococcus antarcticus DSM 14505 TaxID=1185653 RepID=A0A1C7DH76_9BACL|nr:DUF1259 domain-containing protein [Planococcus antarcticus]ANU10910.1 hypothetical protein BBH88_11610 [Planococcus antarcticus DSM 14505]EIM05170.1 hypothetical protein A1A1_17595 [Planococcus antarcticus DSM 14505]
MIETDVLSLTAEKVSRFLGAKMELHEGFWQLVNKRTIKTHDGSNLCVSWSLDLSVSFRETGDGHEAMNKAEVFLLPEELPIFTDALLQHPILFPSSYSQQLSTERGMYCIRLTSQEPPEDFAKRLSEAVYALS